LLGRATLRPGLTALLNHRLDLEAGVVMPQVVAHLIPAIDGFGEPPLKDQAAAEGVTELVPSVTTDVPIRLLTVAVSPALDQCPFQYQPTEYRQPIQLVTLR
jgi:hypothetical protein